MTQKMFCDITIQLYKGEKNMVNEVTTIDTNNYAVMAKAMGMSGESSSSDDKPKDIA